jgi:formylmethanofuran dehydrogenase subunit E
MSLHPPASKTAKPSTPAKTIVDAVPADQRCAQCGEQLDPARIRRVGSHPLCTDCALVGIPHTD